jgi:hypothetical protein
MLEDMYKDRKKSFILYKDVYSPVKSLSNEQLGRLFRAIFDYQIDGIEEVDEDIKMPFNFILNSFKADEEKYKEVCERNKRNAKKRWNNENNNLTIAK